MKTYEEIKQKVKDNLSEKRFYHSECVEERCIELAKLYEVDEEKARLVGISHDIAKEMTHQEKLEYVQNNNIKIDEIEKESSQLLHSKVGAKICEKEFGFTEDMVKAIASHTTGKPGMDKLAKILFISDACGKDRQYEDAKYLYELAKKDLEQAIFECLHKSINNIIEKGKKIHLDTIKTINEYLS